MTAIRIILASPPFNAELGMNHHGYYLALICPGARRYSLDTKINAKSSRTISASKSEFTTSPIDDSLATFSRDPVTADYTAPPAFQTKSHHLHPDNIDAPEKNELDPDCTDGVCNVFGKNPAVRASIGGGLIWDSPFGPLRLDVAWPVEGPR